MSKDEPDLPKPLRSAGATNLERRLLEAASHEAPSQELSERMARAIGISLASGVDVSGSAKLGSTSGSPASSTANASNPFVLWVSGALLGMGVLVGAYLRLGRSPKPSTRAALTSPASATPSAARPTLAASVAPPVVAIPPAAPESDADLTPKLAVQHSARKSHGATTGELAAEIALVDAARGALAGGAAQRALSIIREYQTQFPSGTLRPEVAAVKVEALVKLGRTTEAQSLAEQFPVTYGKGPLAERVARLAHLSQQ